MLNLLFIVGHLTSSELNVQMWIFFKPSIIWSIAQEFDPNCYFSVKVVAGSLWRQFPSRQFFCIADCRCPSQSPSKKLQLSPGRGWWRLWGRMTIIFFKTILLIITSISVDDEEDISGCSRDSEELSCKLQFFLLLGWQG